jgi:hypothetical protein
LTSSARSCSVISIVIHPSGSPAQGPDLEVVAGEGVRGAAAVTSARTRSPAARPMMIRRWAWPAPAGSFGGRSLVPPPAYTRN